MQQNFFLNNCCGQLGNHILAYNNLCQISYPNRNTFVPKNSEINKFFKDIKTIDKKQNGLQLNCWQIRNGKKFNQKNNILIEPYLGELFYYSNKIDPRNFLQLKEEFKIILDKNKNNIAIHLRKSCSCPYNKQPIINDQIHCKCIKSKRKIIKNNVFYDYEYIKNSIYFCLKKFNNCHFIIFGAKNEKQFTTDVANEKYLTMKNFKLYDDIINFFNKNKNLSYELSITQLDNNKSYIYDFSQMSECDIIISSPSTFCLGASITGKKNKFIIHNIKLFKELKKINDKGDIFWFETYEGGNNYYKVNKYIS